MILIRNNISKIILTFYSLNSRVLTYVLATSSFAVRIVTCIYISIQNINSANGYYYRVNHFGVTRLKILVK